MGTTKAGKKRTSVQRRQRAACSLSGFSGAGLALPEEELRRLVLRITARESVGPFVRRMVRLMDSLDAGRTSLALRWARNSKDPSLARLMAAVSRTAQDGYFGTAHVTALCAAGYAYQNSLDYLRDLLRYIERFKQPRSR